MITLRLGHFNLTPTVKATAQLVRRGPYRFVRHPMYLALLLVTLALLLDAPSWLRTLGWLILLLDLLLKIAHEERLLRLSFPAYATYATQSARLVPWLY